MRGSEGFDPVVRRLRAVYAAAELLDAVRLPKLAEYAHVGSNLLFALGSIQASSGIAHRGLRSRRGLVTPKILRDVLEVGPFLIAVALILHHALRIDLGGLLATSAALSMFWALAKRPTQTSAAAAHGNRRARELASGTRFSLPRTAEGKDLSSRAR